MWTFNQTSWGAEERLTKTNWTQRSFNTPKHLTLCTSDGLEAVYYLQPSEGSVETKQRKCSCARSWGWKVPSGGHHSTEHPLQGGAETDLRHFIGHLHLGFQLVAVLLHGELQNPGLRGRSPGERTLGRLHLWSRATQKTDIWSSSSAFDPSATCSKVICILLPGLTDRHTLSSHSLITNCH